MQNNGIDYIKNLISNGHKIGIFSCEDPLNTPFHRALLSFNNYLHLKTEAGALVSPVTLELGLTHKSITSFGVFGHYGNINGHEVCGAVNAILRGHEHEQPNFKKHLQEMENIFSFDMSEIATRTLFASAQSKRAISEYAQKHAPCFSTGSVFDKTKPIKDNVLGLLKNQFDFMVNEIARIKKSAGIVQEINVFRGMIYNLSLTEHKLEILHEKII